MSNQFPPANGQDPNQPGANFGGSTPASSSGYGASTPGYQGYQGQSNYQGYGEQPGNQQQPGAQQGYGSYGSNPQQGSSNSYGSYGAPQGGQPQQGQPAQQGYGGYAASNQQPQHGQPAQPGYGAYQQQQQPPKKGVAPWIWIVAGVAALALVIGAIFGIMALMGGGNKYALNSKTGVDDVTLSWNGEGDWEDAGFGTDDSVYLTQGQECLLMGTYGDAGFDLEQYDSVQEAIEEESSSEFSATNYEDLGTVTLKDTEGENVEFSVARINVDQFGTEQTGYVAFHAFTESNSMLGFVNMCQSEDIGKDAFLENIDVIDFTIVPTKN